MTADFRHPSKLLTGLLIGIFAVVVIVLTARAASRINQPGVRYPEIDSDAWALRDFRDAIYFPVRAILDGVSPYHVEEYVKQYPVGQDFPLYSPLTLIVHLPFAWMPFEISQWVYFGITIVLTLVLAWVVLMACRLPLNPATIFGLATLVLSTRPGHMNLLLGQTTIPMVLCSLLGLHFAQSRPWTAGCFMALATIKPSFGVPLMMLTFAMGHRRAALSGLLISTCVTLPLVLWIVSMQGGWEESWRIVRENGQTLYENPGRDPSRSFSRIDLLALWARLAQTAPPKLFELIATGGVVGLSCLILSWVGRHQKPRSVTDPAAAFALLVMLIAIYHHAYDALLLVPILLTASLGLDAFWRRWPTWQRWVWWGLIAIPFANYAATNSVISAWEISGSAWIALTCLNGASLLVATAWLAVDLFRTEESRVES